MVAVEKQEQKEQLFRDLERGKANEMSVENGKKVSIEYTLTVDGESVDSNKGGDPFTYTHGENQIVPGLESELVGLTEGDTKVVTVTPEEGYGVVNEEAVLEVNKGQVPEEAHHVGAQLMSQDEEGNVMQPTVVEVRDETVVLDFNHPLAGKTLTFDVRILGVE